MLMSLKKAAAPFILRYAASTLRSASTSADSKDRLWRPVQRHATFLDIGTRATIVNGMKMQVFSRPRVEQEIFLFGEWEPLFTRYLRSISAPEGIFLNVGSNIGYFSLIASSAFREVHAIEASPSTSRRLKAIIADNGIDNITVHNMAVGAHEGEIDFFPLGAFEGHPPHSAVRALELYPEGHPPPSLPVESQTEVGDVILNTKQHLVGEVEFQEFSPFAILHC